MATAPNDLVLVTPDNFTRAESDQYFANIVDSDGFGKYFHIRDLTPIDNQLVIRANRDTLYSAAVFDLDAGPVTITLPDAGERFTSLQIIDEDHYTHAVIYDTGEHTISREDIRTRYVAAPIRTLVDPNDLDDLSAVHALQDSVGVTQAGPGVFDIPKWDPVSQKLIRDSLVTLALTVPDTKRMFGTKADTDPVRHLIGTANAWGGNPEKDALYLTVVPQDNDGNTVHRLTVAEVPVDGFWSVTVYTKEGYFSPNEQNSYSFNNVTAQKNVDGSTTIQFGGCGNAGGNCLPVTPGWNYTVRLYRPQAQILDGSWTFPDARLV